MFGKMMNNYYYGKSGKGDFRKEDLPRNRWQLFWEMLRVRFAALCRLNLMTVAAWLPLIILIGYCITTLMNVMMIRSEYAAYVDTGDVGQLTEQQISLLSGLDLDVWMVDMAEHLLPVVHPLHRHYRSGAGGPGVCDPQLEPRRARLHLGGF